MSMARSKGVRTNGNVFESLGFSSADAENLRVRACIMNALIGHIEQRKLTQLQAAKKNLEKIDSIGGGITISKDVKISLAVLAKNADAAKEISEEMKDGLNQAKGLLAVMVGNMEKLAPLVDVVNGIKISADGNIVHIKGEASEELIEKALKKE